MIRFKRNRNKVNPFPIIICLLATCCFMSTVFSFLFLGQMNDLSNQNHHGLKSNITEENRNAIEKYEEESYNESDKSISNQMKIMVNFGFSSFMKTCSESDEIRPITNQCIHTFGFQSSIFESLESLYLLNLSKSFKTAKKIVSKYFTNNQLSFKNDNIVRSELFNRAVASLIGSYLLSNDKSFLLMSEKLVESIMLIDSKSFFPYPILNFNIKQGFERSWENGTSITDIFSGLPEILSLYKITKKDKYLDYVKNLFEKLKKSNLQLRNKEKIQLYTFYDSQSGLNKSVDIINGQNFLNFKEMLESLLRSYYLLDLQEFIGIINDFALPGKLMNDDVFFDSYYFSPYFINSNNNNINNNFQSSYNEKFEFDALFVRNTLRKISYSFLNNQTNTNKISFEDSVNELVDDLLSKTEEKCKSSNGYSGLSFSNNKKQRKNNIQHSAFFGNWINTISQALTYNISFWKYALFNTRGHLLYVK